MFKNGFSQENLSTNHYPIVINKESPKKNKIENKLSSKNIFNNIEFGLMFGATQFFGDIKQLDLGQATLDFLMKLNPHMNYLSKKKLIH